MARRHIKHFIVESNPFVRHEVDSRQFAARVSVRKFPKSTWLPTTFAAGAAILVRMTKQRPEMPDQNRTWSERNWAHRSWPSAPSFWTSCKSNAIAACTLRRMCKVSSASPAGLGLTGTDWTQSERANCKSSWDIKSFVPPIHGATSSKAVF